MTRPRPHSGDCASESGTSLPAAWAPRVTSHSRGGLALAETVSACTRSSTPPQPSRRAAAKSGGRCLAVDVQTPQDTRCRAAEVLPRQDKPSRPRRGLQIERRRRRACTGVLSSSSASASAAPDAVGRIEDQPAARLDRRLVDCRRRSAVARSRPIRSTNRAAGRPPAAQSSRATPAASWRPPASRQHVPARRSTGCRPPPACRRTTSEWPMPKAALRRRREIGQSTAIDSTPIGT